MREKKRVFVTSDSNGECNRSHGFIDYFYFEGLDGILNSHCLF